MKLDYDKINAAVKVFDEMVNDPDFINTNIEGYDNTNENRLIIRSIRRRLGFVNIELKQALSKFDELPPWKNDDQADPWKEDDADQKGLWGLEHQ